MKKFLVLLPLLASCEWILTHPTEDAEIVKLAEEAASDLYRYETGQTVKPAVVAPTNITP